MLPILSRMVFAPLQTFEIAFPWILAELAAHHGYSDQAHLTHSMRQWFGYSPQQLRQAPSYLSGIELDGYC
jgi:AraC-like DNA-binding protein